MSSLLIKLKNIKYAKLKKNYFIINKEFKLSSNFVGLTMDQLLSLNAFLSNEEKKWNQNLSHYYLGVKFGYIFLNLEYTIYLLRSALCFISDVSSYPKSSILFYSYFFKQESFLKQQLNGISQLYFNNVWVSGGFTNYKKIYFFVNKVLKFNIKRKKYLYFANKKRNYIKKYTNLYNSKKIPNVIIALKASGTMLLETKLLKIPVISFVETEGFLNSIDYPILINDDSLVGFQFYLRVFKNAILIGKLRFFLRAFKFQKTNKYYYYLFLKIFNKAFKQA